ncbi:MAG: glycoside hydrolase family 28 protein [Candidatus Coproplasma sp.]
MKIIALTSRSVTIELENDKAYYADEEYKIFLNGEEVKNSSFNVFSLFNLQPDTSYTVNAHGQECSFKTLTESAIFNVTAFGAKGDGVTDDTKAFSAVIGCLPPNGTLYVPEGKYLLSPLFLTDNITLWLAQGATLLGKTDRNDYPVLPALEGGENLGTWQGEEADCFASLLTAYGKSNVKIIGEGVIDCDAPSGDWYVNHRVKRIAWRPRGVYFNRCSNVLMQGITVKNTPSWNVHPYFCKDVTLCDLTLINPPQMPTTDGIDPDSCHGVNIVGVRISVGDDCIAIKSGTLECAKKYRTPCKDVTIRNCLMQSGHGGVVLGSELSGGIEDITVSQCVFEGTDRGLRIKTRRGRGRIGVVDGITFSDIEMKGVKSPFVINMYYNMGDETGHTEYVYTTQKLPVDERTPYIGKFTFKNMVCTDVSCCAGAFYGLPEAPIGGITFENVSFAYDENAQADFPDMKEINQKVCKMGLYFQFVDKVSIKNVKLDGADGEPVILEGVNNFKQSKN